MIRSVERDAKQLDRILKLNICTGNLDGMTKILAD